MAERRVKYQQLQNEAQSEDDEKFKGANDEEQEDEELLQIDDEDNHAPTRTSEKKSTVHTTTAGKNLAFNIGLNTTIKVLIAIVFLLLALILILQLSAIIVMASKGDIASTVVYLRGFADQQTQATQDMANSIAYLSSVAHQESAQMTNNTNAVNLIQKLSEASTEKLTNIVSTLTALKGTGTSTARVVDDMLIVVEELLEMQNSTVLFNSIRPVSCNDILKALPDSPSGYYYVNNHNIYCNMGQLCGTGGGWTRLAYLDMTDATVNCPTGLKLYQSGDVRACGRPNGGASCASVTFPSYGLNYSQICGRVVGYQFGSPDAADTVWGDNDDYNNTNTYYVDGVSITHGSPRQLVWTLIAGYSDTYPGNVNCPCNTPPGVAQQSFIGSNYFCESGNHFSNWTAKLYTDDPLWDGKGCGPEEGNCCSAPGLPWFHRDYGDVTTNDYIELRVCGDQPTNDEDSPVNFYEIYVK